MCRYVQYDRSRKLGQYALISVCQMINWVKLLENWQCMSTEVGPYESKFADFAQGHLEAGHPLGTVSTFVA